MKVAIFVMYMNTVVEIVLLIDHVVIMVATGNLQIAGLSKVLSMYVISDLVCIPSTSSYVDKTTAIPE